MNLTHLSVKSKVLPSAQHQLAFHSAMSVFWLVAMVIIPFLHTFQGGANVAALLIMEVSLYANFATEFGSIAASQASVNTGNSLP